VDEQDLLLDEVVVVEQPLAGRRRSSGGSGGLGKLAVVSCQCRGRALHEGYERRGAQALIGDPGLLRGQDSGFLGEAVGREQLAAQRSVAEGGRCGCRSGLVRHVAPRRIVRKAGIPLVSGLL
jgi:hypothetical protein